MTYVADEKLAEAVERVESPVKRTILASEIDWSKPRKALPERGYVYFIQAAESLRIKIGIAVDPASRLHQIQGHCSEQVGLGAIVPSVWPRQLELNLHRLFAAHHSHREWFNNAPEIVDWVDEHAFTGDDITAELWPDRRPPGWARPRLVPPCF